MNFTSNMRIIGAICNNARVTGTKVLGDATDVALVEIYIKFFKKNKNTFYINNFQQLFGLLKPLICSQNSSNNNFVLRKNSVLYA